jgi:hypothetical protein
MSENEPERAPAAEPTPNSESGADLVAGAFDTALATPKEDELPAHKEFQPWHRPRKQYVREQQWVIAIRDLIRRLREFRGSVRHINYLTLPGDELLDVRVAHEVCAQNEVLLRYLGFNSARGDLKTRECEVSQSEVRQLSHVDGPGSRLVLDRIETIARDKSIGYDALQTCGPYDVVNLDLCDCVAGDPPMTQQSMFDAIAKLLIVQKARRAEPWVLFLTTRANAGRVDDRVLQRLVEIIDANKSASTAFREAANAVGVLDERATWVRDHEAFSRGLTLGLGKWLLRLVDSGEPRWQVRLSSAFSYSVQQPMDMLSLVFEFEPTIRAMHDPIALAPSIPPVPDLIEAETDLAVELVQAIRRFVDVDRELREDAQLMESMILASIKLLGSARYDTSTYRKWIETRSEERRSA